MNIESRKLFVKNIWFINAGLLNDANYNRALSMFSTNKIDTDEMNTILHLLIEHLVQYFELVSLNCTKLMTHCIKRHLQFVENLVLLNDNGGKLYMASDYWNVIYTVLDHFDTSDDHVVKQLCVDALERICDFITLRSRFWLLTDKSLMYLGGFLKQKRDSVIYNSFLIPRSAQYNEIFIVHEPKIFEKIELECNCRIEFFYDYANCHVGNDYILMEVLFDWYRGNFLGFLDSLTYIVKYINPTKHFIKSLRTIVRTTDMAFQILNDVPMTELVLIEKSVRANEKMAPFLPSTVKSKELYSIYLPSVSETIQKEIEEFINDNEVLSFWKEKLSKPDYWRYTLSIKKFLIDHQCYLQMVREWQAYKDIQDLHVVKRSYLDFSNIKITVDDDDGDLEKATIQSNEESKDFILSEDKNEDNVKDDKASNNEDRNVDEDNKGSNDEDKNDDNDGDDKGSNNKDKNGDNDEDKASNDKDKNEDDKASNNKENLSEKGSKNSNNKTSGSSRRSKLSISVIDNKKTAASRNSLQSKSLDIFQTFYNRRTENQRSKPENTLNHILRVLLRCDTKLNDGDEVIQKLDEHHFTIHDLLKNYYNFDLKHQTFYTKAQRQLSYINKEKLKIERRRLERKRLERERAAYLEKRRLLEQEIADAITTIKTKTETISSEDSTVEDFEEEEDVEAENTVDMSQLQPTSFETLLLDDDLLFGDYKETKELLSPDFRKHIVSVLGELLEDLLNLFIDSMKNAEIWKEILENKEAYQNLFPLKTKALICDTTQSYTRQVHQEQVHMLTQSVSTNVYVTLRILSKSDPNLDKEFPNLIKGIGLKLNFIDQINSYTGTQPKFVCLVDSRDSVYLTDASHNLCVAMFDLYLICASLYAGIGVVFDYHLKNLENSIKKLSKPIKDLYKLFNFEERLEEARTLYRVRLQNRTNEEIGVLLKLSQDFRRFNQLVYNRSCCTWRKEQCIRILYASMIINGTKKCIEPFKRQSGDRRLKKIETKCNCVITLKYIIHPPTGMELPFIEIYYDFFKGNHFATMDMIRHMLSETRGSSARLTNLRHLICFPYGELWVINDLEWLRTRVSFMLAQEFNKAPASIYMR